MERGLYFTSIYVCTAAHTVPGLTCAWGGGGGSTNESPYGECLVVDGSVFAGLFVTCKRPPALTAKVRPVHASVF